MNKFLIVLIALLVAQSPLIAQGWIKTYYDYGSNWITGFGEKTLDNGYVTVGHIGISGSNLHVKKTDAFGNVQWTYSMNKVGSQASVGIKQVPSTGGYLILYNDSQLQSSPHLLSLDAMGQEVYDRTINIGMDVYTGSSKTDLLITAEQDLLITSGAPDSLNFYTVGLAKLDLAGNTIWSKLIYHAPNYQTRPMDVLETTDGNYLLSCQIDTSVGVSGGGNGSQIHLIKTDTAGNDLWRTTLASLGPKHRPFDAINSSDGGYLIMGDYNWGSNAQALTVKVNATGQLEWDWKSVSTSTSNKCRGAVENADGTYTITGYVVPTAPPYNTVGFIKLSATGALLLDNGSSTGTNVPNGKKIYTNGSGGYSIFGVDAKGHFIITTDSLGVLYSNQVVGKYFHDVNANCIYDAGEPLIFNRPVYATKGTETRYANSYSNGNYLLEVDTGTYTISTRTLSPYWQFCQNPQTVTFTNFYSKDTVDFALQIVDTCTYMEVDLSTPILRRCFPSTYYVRYDNWGTEAAQNAYVELTLDPYITFDSSSIPLTQQTGNVYRFDIGNVPMTTGGAFAVHVTVDCDSTVLGQVHCVEAHIYPDTICIPNYWNGPVIRTSSTCLNDSVIFLLENIGANMGAPQDYSIIEEHVMIQITPFQLGSGLSQSVTVPAAPGATYRMEAAQATGFPPLLGDSIAISNYVGCNTPPVINFPGLLGQFYNGNSSPSIAVDCRANVGAYDPNDKQGQPLGYGAQHYINQNIPLNYHIRFQNTGTDTAFTVVVIDTIAAHLDPASIRMGASSHSYTWELRENGILVVTFDNIMLPDSNVNERASNGFFKFEIQQQVNNPIGTVITNRAGIYFDFNPPVMTNETFHTIGEDFIAVMLTGTENVLDDMIDIQVFPNPFKDFTTIQVNGKDYERLELEVVNVTGQLVESIQVENTNQIILNKNRLLPGAYFYRLKGDQKLLNTGKLIVR